MAGLNQVFSLSDDIARYVKACGKNSVLGTKLLRSKINIEGLQFASDVIGDTVRLSNKIQWSPRWMKQGFQMPQNTTKLDFTEEGLKISQMLRKESEIPYTIKIPHTYIDGDLGIRVLDNGKLSGWPHCEIVQVDFFNDKTLINVIDQFKSKLAQNTDLSEIEKIKMLTKYVDEIFSVNKSDNQLYDLTKQFPEGKIINLGEIIDSGAGVCRHRSLLLKILGDKTDMKVSLVKGCYDDGQHAWNEIVSKSGKKYLVDSMHRNIIDLSEQNILDLRVLSYFKGNSNSYLYANECTKTKELFNHLWDLQNNQAMSLGGKAKLYKPNGRFALYPEINQEIIVNGKRLEKGCFLNNNDIIEYLDTTDNPIKIIWKNPIL